MQTAKKQFLCFCFSALFTTTTVFAASNDIAQHWAASTIHQWISAGYISGYPDGSFQPDAPITRAEFVSLANKVFHLDTASNVSFSDVSSTHWAYKAIQTAVSNGYAAGDENNAFYPDRQLTRAEAASMIAGLTHIAASDTALHYSDNSQIPLWAENAVAAVSQAGIMKGFPDGTFRPQSSITRAEAVTALSEAVKNTASSVSLAEQQTITLEHNSMQNQTIAGDVVIPASISSEEIILDHVTIDGTLFVEGGSTISIRGCHINQIVLKEQHAVIYGDTASNISSFVFSAPGQIAGNGFENVVVSDTLSAAVTIDADVESLEIKAPVSVKLFANADIASLYVLDQAEEAAITFTENAAVDQCTVYSKIKILGNAGNIDTLTVYVNDVETDIKPNTLLLRENANRITYTASQSTKAPAVERATERIALNTDNQGFHGNAKAYKSATISAKDASLSNAVIEEDLTIQQSIKNTGASLKALTVNGNINIYGGRDPITIENCIVEGDIISHRSDRTPVTLKFDENTVVNGSIVIRGNTILTGEKNTVLKNVLAEQYSGRNLEIDIHIEEMELTTTAVSVKLNENKKIDTLRLSSAPNTLHIHMAEGSVIDTIYADANISITGTGTVHKIISQQSITLSPTVTVEEVSDGFVAVSDIISVPETMYKGKSLALTGIVKPFDASSQNIHWSIEDAGTTGAALNGNVLTAPQEGTVMVTAEIINGLGHGEHFLQSFAIQVKDELENFVAVEDIAMTSPTTWDINTPLVLSGTVTPSDATYQLINWSIQYDDDTNAKLVNNELTSKLSGTITLIASIEKGLDGTNAFTKEFHVNIVPMEEKFIKVEDILLNTPNECLAGDILQLSANVVPSDATAQRIQWAVVDAGKTGAYIQNHTTLYTRKPGTILLSATIAGGDNGISKSYYKEFYITVKERK